MTKLTIFLTAIIIICSVNCHSSKIDTVYTQLKSGITTIQISDRHEGSKSSKMIGIDIFIPKKDNFKGDILVLPGWKYSRTRWYKETDLLKYAEEIGFRIIFPEMNITNYESRYFPETKIRWAATPGGQWIKEIMIPYLQKKYGIFLPGNKNFLLGLSTGGRGVLLVSLQNPGLFTAGAVLSGDCNQVKMPKDNLMTGAYGPYEKFKERWATVDNPEISATQGKWEMPIYIGHGKKDRVTPFEQSESMYETLKKYYPELKTHFNAPDNAGHDFKYWGSEVKPVLEFFLSIQ